MAHSIRSLEKVLAEVDAVIRVRLKEIGLQAPHLVIAVTPDGEVVLRSNVSPDVLRSFGEDLKNIADELEAEQASKHRIHESGVNWPAERWTATYGPSSWRSPSPCSSG